MKAAGSAFLMRDFVVQMQARARISALGGSLKVGALVAIGLLAAGPAAAQQGAPIIIAMNPGKWAVQPTDQQREAARPPGPKGRGMAIFSRCTVTAEGALTDCTIRTEPEDSAYRAAAEKLLPIYRLSVEDARMVAAVKGKVDFAVGWQPEECKPPFCGEPQPATGEARQAPPRR